MQAGKLNRQINIQARSSTQDPTGQPIDTWTTVWSCWAGIASLTGKELYALGAGFSGQLSHKVTIRYTATPLLTGMRVVYGKRTFLVQIPPANPNEANVEIDLVCLEQS